LSSLYDQLPVDFLSSFYFEIKKNIEKGILTEAMNFELNLIVKAAQKKGVAIEELHNYRLVY
jgi:hypothetical protein